MTVRATDPWEPPASPGLGEPPIGVRLVDRHGRPAEHRPDGWWMRVPWGFVSSMGPLTSAPGTAVGDLLHVWLPPEPPVGWWVRDGADLVWEHVPGGWLALRASRRDAPPQPRTGIPRTWATVCSRGSVTVTAGPDGPAS